MIQLVTLPDGKRVSLDQGCYFANERYFCVTRNNDTIASYACLNSTGAAGMVTQTDTGLAAVAAGTNSNTVLSDTGAFVWTSLTLNTYTISGVSYDGTIAGSGFNGASLTFQFNDGSGHLSSFVPYASNNTSIAGHATFTITGTYTLYYSLDAGLTWTTTALTLTVS